MITDAWFAIGDTHVVCQDFAVAGHTADGNGFAVVCDGCSSSPDTDVGARLLAAAACIPLRQGQLPGPEMGETVETVETVEMAKIVEQAAHAAAMLQLPPHCLDATLLVALTDQHCCRVRVFGDGVVAAVRHGGQLQVHRFEQPDGAPPYPSYELDPERRRQWHERCSPILREHVWQEHVSRPEPTSIEQPPSPATVRSELQLTPSTAHEEGDSSIHLVHDTHETSSIFVRNKHEYIHDLVRLEHRSAKPVTIEHRSPPQLCFARDEFTSVALGSDGLDAFVHVEHGVATPVPTTAVLERLLHAPQPRGRFLVRRGRRFLRRECVRDGWRPTDDVSLAIIRWSTEAA